MAGGGGDTRDAVAWRGEGWQVLWMVGGWRLGFARRVLVRTGLSAHRCQALCWEQLSVCPVPVCLLSWASGRLHGDGSLSLGSQMVVWNSGPGARGPQAPVVVVRAAAVLSRFTSSSSLRPSCPRSCDDREGMLMSPGPWASPWGRCSTSSGSAPCRKCPDHRDACPLFS